MNGKGSKRRPGDPKKYAEGWERIWGSNTKRVQKKAKCVQPPYPSWVCGGCAAKAGGKCPGLGTTWHTAVCHVCGSEAWVTEPRDFDYPRFKGFRDRETMTPEQFYIEISKLGERTK